DGGRLFSTRRCELELDNTKSGERFLAQAKKTSDGSASVGDCSTLHPFLPTTCYLVLKEQKTLDITK
ncbi:hypothetical protein, partial [Sphingobacterium siyangense]|uniref:hypothetical protein n=1 Tax=Sphingobacterium siyangense TaxID=459529 RepID=UPI0030171BB1